MTASSIKGAIKGTLKGILNTAAPVFSRRSAMDSASARETLLVESNDLRCDIYTLYV